MMEAITSNCAGEYLLTTVKIPLFSNSAIPRETIESIADLALLPFAKLYCAGNKRPSVLLNPSGRLTDLRAAITSDRRKPAETIASVISLFQAPSKTFINPVKRLESKSSIKTFLAQFGAVSKWPPGATCDDFGSETAVLKYAALDLTTPDLKSMSATSDPVAP